VFSYLAEMEALQQIKKTKVTLVHNTHLEDNHGFLGNYRDEENFSLLATSHLPASWWKYTFKNKRPLQELELLLTLTSKERDFFEEIIPGRVVQVHHGTDTDFLTLAGLFCKESRAFCLWEVCFAILFFEEVISHLLQLYPGKFWVDMVCSPAADDVYTFLKLCRHSQVSLHRNIFQTMH